MAKYDGILLCSDLDGTLAGDDNLISKENAEAITYFKENGGLFTLATGRSAPYLTRHDAIFSRSGIDFLPNVPVITHNGASVFDYDKNEYIYSLPLPGDDIERILLEKACEDDNIECIFLSGAGERAQNIIEKTNSDNFREIVLDEYDHGNATWYKMVFCTREEEYAKKIRDELREYFEKSGRYTVNRTWGVGVEVLKHDATKGIAVRWLQNYLGKRVNKLICVGDFENDVPMIMEADLGVAVGNASEELKACADVIGVKNSEHALKYVIELLDTYFDLDA